jgi:hypothetical protein
MIKPAKIAGYISGLVLIWTGRGLEFGAGKRDDVLTVELQSQIDDSR